MNRSKFGVIIMLAVLFQLFISLTAHAQTINLYDSRGREIRKGNPFPLDRFSRGEQCTVKVSNPDGWGYYVIYSDRGFERGSWDFWRNLTDTFNIMTSPFADNVTVYVYNYARGVWVSLRIPIGSK